jgi:hypothetical protein
MHPTRTRTRKIVSLILLAVAALATQAGASPVSTLQPETPEQVEARIKTLQAMGDLAGYIDSIDDDGTIVLRRLARPGSACGTTPPVTTFGKPLVVQRLAIAERALDIVNLNLTRNRKTQFRFVQKVC